MTKYNSLKERKFLMENIVIRKAILEDVSYIQNLNNELFKLEKKTMTQL